MLIPGLDLTSFVKIALESASFVIFGLICLFLSLYTCCFCCCCFRHKLNPIWISRNLFLVLLILGIGTILFSYTSIYNFILKFLDILATENLKNYFSLLKDIPFISYDSHVILSWTCRFQVMSYYGLIKPLCLLLCLGMLLFRVSPTVKQRNRYKSQIRKLEKAKRKEEVKREIEQGEKPTSRSIWIIQNSSWLGLKMKTPSFGINFRIILFACVGTIFVFFGVFFTIFLLDIVCDVFITAMGFFLASDYANLPTYSSSRFAPFIRYARFALIWLKSILFSFYYPISDDKTPPIDANDRNYFTYNCHVPSFSLIVYLGILFLYLIAYLYVSRRLRKIVINKHLKRRLLGNSIRAAGAILFFIIIMFFTHLFYFIHFILETMLSAFFSSYFMIWIIVRLVEIFNILVFFCGFSCSICVDCCFCKIHIWTPMCDMCREKSYRRKPLSKAYAQKLKKRGPLDVSASGGITGTSSNLTLATNTTTRSLLRRALGRSLKLTANGKGKSKMSVSQVQSQFLKSENEKNPQNPKKAVIENEILKNDNNAKTPTEPTSTEITKKSLTIDMVATENVLVEINSKKMAAEGPNENSSSKPKEDNNNDDDEGWGDESEEEEGGDIKIKNPMQIPTIDGKNFAIPITPINYSGKNSPNVSPSLNSSIPEPAAVKRKSITFEKEPSQVKPGEWNFSVPKEGENADDDWGAIEEEEEEPKKKHHHHHHHESNLKKEKKEKKAKNISFGLETKEESSKLQPEPKKEKDGWNFEIKTPKEGIEDYDNEDWGVEEPEKKEEKSSGSKRNSLKTDNNSSQSVKSILKSPKSPRNDEWNFPASEDKNSNIRLDEDGWPVDEEEKPEKKKEEKRKSTNSKILSFSAENLIMPPPKSPSTSSIAKSSNLDELETPGSLLPQPTNNGEWNFEVSKSKVDDDDGWGEEEDMI